MLKTKRTPASSLRSARQRFIVGIAGLIGIGAACVGCGDAGPEIVPVSGKVTLNGGEWPVEGEIIFAPTEVVGEMPLIPGFGTIDRQGNFKAECNSGEGLVPGKYKVTIECWELKPDESRSENPQGKSLVPERYRSAATTPLEFELKSGELPGPLAFDVVKP